MNGMPPTLVYLFHSTHQRCKDNSWVDTKSKQVNVINSCVSLYYTITLLWIFTFIYVQRIPPQNELDVWCDVAETKNGRIYGLGLESTMIGYKPYYRGLSSSSNGWIQSQEL
ncbi:uncharacterized protein LOC114163597 [Vigna unguiculata]|uniref:uncharacterized protein LOC114163597 n=1 Tax=Vigna unguiculata TaxID=3917 RepID=UPI001015D7D2|nr:uncharacterized protein LOC114163597 [Vigna unguiculata]